MDTIGEYSCTIEGRNFTVQVIDPVMDYVELMKEIFNFDEIKSLVGAGGALKVFQLYSLIISKCLNLKCFTSIKSLYHLKSYFRNTFSPIYNV